MRDLRAGTVAGVTAVSLVAGIIAAGGLSAAASVPTSTASTTVGREQVVGSAAGGSSACTVARIAFVRDLPRRGRSDIYGINPNGTELTQLTHAGDAWSRAWSPDGARIAYEDWSDGDAEIYVMNPDGSDVVQLTDNTFEDSTPAWSPDGEWIAFARSDDEFTDFDLFDIHVMRADGSEVTQLTDLEAQEWTPTCRPTPRGSPSTATTRSS